jgi:uncharacterized protein YbcC (UPF0753/DUF2309 family)
MSLANVKTAQEAQVSPVSIAVAEACSRIAPTWPLDRMIAVNPWWEMRGEEFAQVSAKVAALGQVHCLMPATYYKQAWQNGGIDATALRQALAESDGSITELQMLAALEHEPAVPHWHNISDLLDGFRDRQHQIAWRDEITQQISQFCAAHFQHDSPLRSSGDLYRHWLEITRRDRGIAILMGEPTLDSHFQHLPDNAEDLLELAFGGLQVPAEQMADYAHALLLDINGWASWVAYERWQARLASRDHHQMEELLAVRAAWELVLWRHHQGKPIGRQLRHLWLLEQRGLPQLLQQHRAAQAPLLIWQRAVKITYQHNLQEILAAPIAQAQSPTPQLQAVFCIDVRSEPLRRALEAQSPDVQTLGFAGFFGLPLEYKPAGSISSRPHLPGLLSPVLQVREGGAKADALSRQRASANLHSAGQQEWSRAAPSTFSVVEALGLGYAWKLLRNTLRPTAAPVARLTASEWTLERSGNALNAAEKAQLVQKVLRGMGITSFAPFVLLVGHVSQSCNNAHAAGLECGACGGQSGELSVRVLAQLLNDQEVRAELSQLGIQIPISTRFLPALHNTVTDEILVLEHTKIFPETYRNWLVAARNAAQLARADSATENATSLAKKLRRKTADWAEVRPEKGLANNAAFIAAPRHLTRQLDLQGRCFLHEYDQRLDADFSVLEQIMTAPVVVAHWINMQYNASVTDPVAYGSGNKLLHNVVGGHLGVFEGNGGDLRIGLPLQSVHDGENWIHQPLRLTVVVAAPKEALQALVSKHEVLRQLFHNGWAYLCHWHEETRQLERYDRGSWRLLVA